jgi:4-amino-4-deoxychorismate lyase
MSLLVETIKIENGNILNIRFHNERMIRSLYAIYGLRSFPELEKHIIVPEFARSGIFKCRVIYDNRSTHFEFLPYSINQVRSLKLIVDDYICYPYKYIARDKINQLMELKEDCDDILIIKNGMVTDSSYANVVFRDSNNNWVTPSTFLLSGTRRASLLEKRLISETAITSEDIKTYTEIKLINAMLDLDDTEGITIENIV